MNYHETAVGLFVLACMSIYTVSHIGRTYHEDSSSNQSHTLDDESPDTPFEIAAVQYVEDTGITEYTYYCLEASSEYAQCDFTLYQDDFVSFLSLFCYVNQENVYCILK